MTVKVRKAKSLYKPTTTVKGMICGLAGMVLF
jgi:hypothetical protein